MVSKKRKDLIALAWYGGKYRQLNFLRSFFPEGDYHFCDVFGGSATVIMNVGPYPLETYNDIDSEVVNFFETLRHPEDGPILIEALKLTLYSREEFGTACGPNEDVGRIERARRLYVRSRQSWRGRAQETSVKDWAISISISPHVKHPTRGFKNSIDKLPKIIDRFREMQIENLPAVNFIRRYDKESTLFYLDPPYVLSTRQGKAYNHEMTDEQHIELSDILHKIKGKAVLSGFQCSLYDRLYADWRRIEAPNALKRHANRPHKECAWLNF